MRRIELPIISSKPDLKKEVELRKVRLRSRLELLFPEAPPMAKIARAFALQDYPLTEIGERLKYDLLRAIDSGDISAIGHIVRLLPTVESPRLELFRDLDLSEEQKYKIVGYDLATIQVTKGCSKQCSFCAVTAGKKIEFMPFPMVLQLAQIKNELELKSEVLFQDWMETLSRHMGYDVEAFFENVAWYHQQETTNPEILGQCHPEVIKIQCEAAEIYPRHELSQIIPYKVRNNMVIRPVPCNRFVFDTFKDLGSITNYYDSDPIDYRDSDFPHLNGNPADYGDVASVLASEKRRLHITTTGWTTKDRIGRKAGEKIANMYWHSPEKFYYMRISITSCHGRALNNMDKYAEDVLGTIPVIGPHANEIMCFYTEGDDNFISKVLQPLRKLVKELGIEDSVLHDCSISKYSGREREDGYEDDHDVMACMPGYHIWPDGQVAFQKDTPHWHNGHFFEAPKGSRPEPIGFQITQKP